MTVCKQLNYLHRKTSSYGDYSEELLADGEVGGRNWSLIERTWLRDCRWRGGKYHYILRIDISEYQEGYGNLIYKKGYTFENMQKLLFAHPRGCDMLRFSMCNRSPGLWENGFNPNYWLEAEIGTYTDESNRLQKIIETGHDMRDMNDIGLIVKESLNELAPLMKKFKDAGPVGVPYHYWWGIKEPPPPRKPVY